MFRAFKRVQRHFMSTAICWFALCTTGVPKDPFAHFSFTNVTPVQAKCAFICLDTKCVTTSLCLAHQMLYTGSSVLQKFVHDAPVAKQQMLCNLHSPGIAFQIKRTRVAIHKMSLGHGVCKRVCNVDFQPSRLQTQEG